MMIEIDREEARQEKNHIQVGMSTKTSLSSRQQSLNVKYGTVYITTRREGLL